MENKTAMQLFNEQFKFSLNQEVRHKGDSKIGLGNGNDMGLLVLVRELEESSDDDGNVHYSRYYICRMIRYSGSGDIAKFKESELMSIQEYTLKQIQDAQQHEDILNNTKMMTQEIFDSFGVRRFTKVTLKHDADKYKHMQIPPEPDTHPYTVTGFLRNEEGTFLRLRRIAGAGIPSNHDEDVLVKSKDEFEIMPAEQ